MLELLQYRAWALAESYFNRMYPVVQDAIRSGHNLVVKKTIEDYVNTIQSHLFAEDNPGDVQITFARDSATNLPIARANGKNIALIPIIGPLSKYGDLCSIGMQDYQRLINIINTTASIDGGVMIMDTPGGTVDGTPEFGLAIKNSKKPMGVFGDHQVASAGLWLASQAAVIIGNKNNPTEFGSIGVLMGLPNYDNMMKAGNYPVVEIFRASQSKEKALVNPYEAISDSSREKLQSSLDSIASDFIGTVKAGRGDKLDTKAEGLFAGRMFSANDAKKIGLIDSVGTLQTAVNKVAELARQQQKLQTGTTATKATANTEMKFPKISALFGKSGKEATAEQSAEQESPATADQASMEAAEKKLADMEASIADVTAKFNAATAEAATLHASVTELTAQVSTLTGEKSTLTETNTKLVAENAEQKALLDKKPTGEATTIVSNPGKEANQAADDSSVQTNRAMLPIEEQAQSLLKFKKK